MYRLNKMYFGSGIILKHGREIYNDNPKQKEDLSMLSICNLRKTLRRLMTPKDTLNISIQSSTILIEN